MNGEKSVSVGNHTILISISDILGDYREVKFFEEYEADEMEDILSEIDSEDSMLDIGANIGIHSLFASQVADHVVAVEPHPVNASHMLVNKWKNDSEIDLYQCAFSDHDGYTGIAGPRGGFLADGSVALTQFELPPKKGPHDGRENQINIRTESGDEFLKTEGIKTPNVVKIDVEGAEEAVINGLSQTLRKSECRLLYCEVHKDRVDYNKIISKLEKFGFDSRVIDTRHNSKTIKCPK